MKPPYNIHRVYVRGNYYWNVFRRPSLKFPMWPENLGNYVSWRIALSVVAQNITLLKRSPYFHGFMNGSGK